MRRFVQDFFYVVDLYVRQYVREIDRAMKTSYNFCYFNILGMV